MSEGKTALLVGASGLVGGHCLQLLLESDHYAQVVVLVRRPLGIDHPKLVEHQIDFDKLGDHKPLFDADDVFCCLGTTIKTAGSQEAFIRVDYTYPVEIARIAKATGASQMLLVSSMGASANSTVFYTRIKGEVEQKIADLRFASTTILRPSLLLGKRPAHDKRPGEEIGQWIGKNLGFLFIGPLRKYRAVTAEAVAAVMVKTAIAAKPSLRVLDSRKIQDTFERL